MKLRIKGDSLRLRLTRPEAQALLSEGSVEEATRFPAGTDLRYALCTAQEARGIVATFDAGRLVVSVPVLLAARWARSNEVAMQAEVCTPQGKLAVLIEKDFPCLAERPNEDDSAAFPRDRLKLGP